MYYKLYLENVCNICMHSFIRFDWVSSIKTKIQTIKNIFFVKIINWNVFIYLLAVKATFLI